MVQGCLDGEEDGLEVQIGRSVEVFLARLAERREIDATRIGRKHIDGAEPLGGRREQTSEVTGVGDVPIDGDDGRAAVAQSRARRGCGRR